MIILYPLAIMVSAALEPLKLGAIGVSFSHALSFQSFSYAWTVGDFRTYLWNTVIVTAAVAAISAVVSVLAAFGISVLRPWGSRVLFYVAILGFMLPTEALIVPWYYQMTSMNFLNTYWAMILPQAAQSVAFGTFWMVTAFRSLPRSLGEAASLDGASQWNLLWKVLAPNVAPAIKTMIALVFLWTWNSFLLPLVMESERFALRGHDRPLGIPGHSLRQLQRSRCGQHLDGFAGDRRVPLRPAKLYFGHVRGLCRR